MVIRSKFVASVALVGVLACAWSLQADSAAAGTESLRVTEIMYNPSEGGAEFLELHNVGDSPIDLSGVSFTDGLDFTFPQGAALDAGAYAVLTSSGPEFTAAYPGVSFAGVYLGRLSDGGERLELSDGGGSPFLSFTYDDAAPWPKAADGLGFSLVLADAQANPDYYYAWRASEELGGSPGELDIGTSDTIPHVLVNEVLTHTDPPMVDAIEFYNPTGADADIRGWYLTDDGDEPQKARVPDDAEFVLAAGAYAVVYESDFLENPGSVGGIDLPGFALSSQGEEVYVFAADESGNVLGYCHGYKFDAARNGVSFGRYVSSDGADHCVAQSSVTLGSINAGPLVGPVVISEIYYNPVVGDTEYLVLSNLSGAPVPLWDTSVGGNPDNTWQVDGIGFAFVGHQTLPAGGTALIVNTDPAEFQSRNGIPGDVLVQGPFGNNSLDATAALDNGGETIRLLWPDTPDVDVIPYVVVDEVKYDDESPWPLADGNGKALGCFFPTQFGNDPANWTAVDPTYPEAEPQGEATDVNGDEQTDAVDVQLVINEALGMSTGHDCDVNDDAIVNAQDVQLVINGALGLR